MLIAWGPPGAGGLVVWCAANLVDQALREQPELALAGLRVNARGRRNCAATHAASLFGKQFGDAFSMP